jgi:hypothetical protein
VDNQLKLLISLCEEEKVRLKKLIDDCLAETEYLMAHHHSQALYQLNGKLQTLKNIDDKLFDEKHSKQRRIDWIKNLMETEISDHMREYFVKDLQRTMEELEILNQIPLKAKVPDNESLLDETLNRLVYKKIKNVKLFLKKADNFFFEFRYSRETLKVILPYVKQHIKKWILHDDKITSLKNLGFEFTVNETKLTLTLTGGKEDILRNLKLILAKIIFEIFYFREFDNESYIQITDKASR